LSATNTVRMRLLPTDMRKGRLGITTFADWDLWIRLGLLSPLVTVPRPLHAYRVHSAGMSTRDTGVGAELDHLERRYRAERSERGVELERCDLEFWIGDRSQRAGRRVAAARAYLRSVGRIPPTKAAYRAAEALLWPELYRVRDWRHGRKVTPAWRAEAEAWLGEFGHPATFASPFLAPIPHRQVTDPGSALTQDPVQPSPWPLH